MTTDQLIQRWEQLPASRIARQVNETLSTQQAVVITAPPGAGKSTLLPLTILNALPQPQKVLMLEPRRLAARQIAERMADMLGEPVGQTVGYRIRFENKTSAQTRVEVLTEGILTRMLTADATLENVGAIIFDEFHERSAHSDLALALTRQAQQIIRPDLKIVIMSATIDASDICLRLNAPLVKSEGRMFTVSIQHTTTDVSPADIPQAAATTVRKALREHEGDILVFLPGQGEIIRCQELLTGISERTAVYPLYGNLPPEQQRRAIAPSFPGERKVVLASPIAETSLTIEGIKTVIDSGLHRTPVFDGKTGLTRLETARISMDMATQRTGRAGRVDEGVCIRLWSIATEHRMEPQRKPEIEEADLAPTLLSIAAFGERHAEDLPWLTPLPVAHVASARQLLQLLGALTDNGDITETGKKMALLPCHPRIARMIIHAQSPAQQSLACDIAALLEEKDPLTDEPSADMSLRISRFRRQRNGSSLGRWARVAQIAHEYHRMARITPDNTDPSAEDIGQLVAYAYPERVAMSTDSIGTFRLSGGSNVKLERSDSLSAYPWIAIASMFSANGNTGRVFLAAPVNPSDLIPLTTVRDNVSWNSKQGCVVMQRERRIGKLITESKPIHDADKQQIISIVCEAVKREGLSMLNWTDDTTQLQRRVANVAKWHPELNIPDLSTEHLLATADEWLPFYLELGDRNKWNTSELKKLDLQQMVWSIVPYELQQEINRLAPTHVTMPTGSNIRIDYRLGAEAPVVSVRLQECFGMERTPCVNGGSQPLLMELLSPGFKPVQLTQDLANFWRETYFEVRKELKRRYPKHYWPENPLQAEAVRGVKRKQ